MGITIPVYLHFVSFIRSFFLFIRSFFQNFFQSKDHEEPEDVRLFGDRNPPHFVRRRSGIETDGRRGNFVERGDGNRPTQRKRRGGIARGGNISQASQASLKRSRNGRGQKASHYREAGWGFLDRI